MEKIKYSLSNRLLCKKCLIDDGFFRGGGSWAPDSCPNCGGTDCVWFDNLNWSRKQKALKIYEEMKKNRGY